MVFELFTNRSKSYESRAPAEDNSGGRDATSSAKKVRVAPGAGKYGERASRPPVKPGFGEVDVALDSAERLVVDRFFVAQRDDRVALCLQHLAG
jgi:hypothetical protein